jgi:hypothetical protein
MKPWATGGNHHAVQVEVSDVPLYHLLTRVRAHELVISGYHDVLKSAGKISHLFNPDFTGNIDPAMTNKKSYPF